MAYLAQRQQKACQPQFRPDGIRVRRSAGNPAGGRCQLFWQGREKALYRGSNKGSGTGGYPPGKQTSLPDVVDPDGDLCDVGSSYGDFIEIISKELGLT